MTNKQATRPIRPHRVFLNIRIFSLLLCLSSVAITGVQAQENSNAEPIEPVSTSSSLEQIPSETETEIGQSNTQAVDNSEVAEDNKALSPEKQIKQQTKPAMQANDGIIRLEDTIRGNKEQPQVLTIVPWQLPVHQRINENTEWQPKVNQLTSIERSAFLRNLAVVNELKRAQNSAANTIETNEAKD